MASIRKRGGSFRAEVFVNRVRRSATFSRYEDASNWAIEQEYSLRPAIQKAEPDLLSEQYLIDISKPFLPQCGVYFLIDGEKIIYVGKSVDIVNRVVKHRYSKVGFQRLAFIECKGKDQLRLEREYIRKFKPMLNNMGNDGYIPQTEKQLAG